MNQIHRLLWLRFSNKNICLLDIVTPPVSHCVPHFVFVSWSHCVTIRLFTLFVSPTSSVLIPPLRESNNEYNVSLEQLKHSTLQY